MNYDISFPHIKMIWSPEGGLQFGVFMKKGQKLKYIRKQSTHTPSTLRAITSGFLNRLTKLTSIKPFIHSKELEKSTPTT